MKLDLVTLRHLKGRLENTSYEIQQVIFGGVKTDLMSILDNVQSDNLNYSIRCITDEIDSLSNGLNEDFYKLIQFMDNQLKSYTVTNEEVKARIERLIELLNQTFDENGNILAPASTVLNTLSANNSSNNVNSNSGSNSSSGISNSGSNSSSGISDTVGYNEGANLQNALISQIGNDRWNIIDETHAYFKEKGLSDEQIAAIVGNMAQESSLNLNAVTGEHKGLFQWSASRQPKSFDLQSQLDRAWEEMSKPDRYFEEGIIGYLQPGDSVDKMTETFCNVFEQPGDNSVGKRQKFAKAAYYYIKENLSGK